MDTFIVAFILIGYFILLKVIAYLVNKEEREDDFYTASKKSKWYLVAFGMVGASLSGVTFISVPGEVGVSNFYYYQVVLGYLVGYFVIARVLIPIYYRLNIVSIYSYLHTRFGFWSYKSGAFFFLISRVIGSSFRLFLVAQVLQVIFFDAIGFPFWVSVATSVILIWLYTYQGGIKTIIWTDVLQTTFIIASVIVSIYFIKNAMDLSWGALQKQVFSSELSSIFNWEWKEKTNFFKQFFAGIFIAIAMTGLDQDMMQKNLTCKNTKEAQKNILWFCVILLIVNFMFLYLGALLYQYADFISFSIPDKRDNLFPLIATQEFSLWGSVIFLLGITAAAYSSADSALTSLTTSFCHDFLGFKKENYAQNRPLRIKVHLLFSFIMFAVILTFNAINNQNVITAVFVAAGYTYGPLLGLFSFGIITSWQLKDRWVPLVCLLSPLASFLIKTNSEALLWGYEFGFEVLILNGLLTFIGLATIRKKNFKNLAQ